MIAQLDHNIHLRQHFTTPRCWTDISTAPAFHTRVKIKQLILFKIFYFSDTKTNLLFIRIIIDIKIYFFHLARSTLAQKHIDRYLNKMNVVTLMDIDEENYSCQCMYPREYIKQIHCSCWCEPATRRS